MRNDPDVQFGCLTGVVMGLSLGWPPIQLPGFLLLTAHSALGATRAAVRSRLPFATASLGAEVLCLWCLWPLPGMNWEELRHSQWPILALAFLVAARVLAWVERRRTPVYREASRAGAKSVSDLLFFSWLPQSKS